MSDFVVILCVFVGLVCVSGLRFVVDLSLWFIHAFGGGDGTGGADEAAEVAAYAACADNLRLAQIIRLLRFLRWRVIFLRDETDGLVTAVLARDIAPAATDTFLAVNLGEDHRLTVEVGGHGEVRQFLAHKVFHTTDTALSHIVLQACGEVIDDTVAVLHDGGAYLHIAAT